MKKQLETSDIQQGSCRYCGQIVSFETIGLASLDKLDEWASEKCDCTSAKHFAQRKKSLEGAKENINKFFGSIPVKGQVVTELMNIAADALYEDKIGSLTINIGNGCNGKISQNSKGKIKVERTDTQTVKYEQ